MKRNKYNAKKTAIIFKGELVKFDSQAESLRAVELQRMEMAGEIHDLTLQPSFELQSKFENNGKKHRAIKYVADFSYMEAGRWVTEDTKGVETAEFKIKMKMLIKRLSLLHVGDSDPDFIFRISKRKGNSFTLTDY